MGILRGSDNARSFLASKCHILCQKQIASLGNPFPELKITSVPACVMGMPLITSKILLFQIISFPGYINCEIPMEEAFLEWCIDLREVDAA